MDNIKNLILLAESKDFGAAKAAILELGTTPFSEESFQRLFRLTEIALTGSGPHSNDAILALGMMGHPRAAHRLVEIVDSGNLSCFEASKALGHPRNNSAVEPLLNVALNSFKYVCVKAAVDALDSIGTPEAISALEQFYEQPARPLILRYTGADEHTIKSSSHLGQKPIDESPESDLAKLVREDPYWFGSNEQMWTEVRTCCTNTYLERSQLNKLKEFLDGTSKISLDASRKGSYKHKIIIHKLSSFRSDYYEVLYALKPELDLSLGKSVQRKNDILRFLLENDTTGLELNLIRTLTTAYSKWAADFLFLLPRINQINRLVELAQSGECTDQFILYIFTNLLKKENLDQAVERKAAIKVLSRLKDFRAIEAIEKAAKADPVEEVRLAAQDTVSEHYERIKKTREENEIESKIQAGRFAIGQYHITAAEAALTAGKNDLAYLEFRSACEEGSLNTFELLVRRRAELEKCLGIKPANELMVLCLEPLLKYYQGLGSHQVQSYSMRLKDARRKLSIK